MVERSGFYADFDALRRDECPEGCGCALWDDADRNECACDGPCCTEEWVLERRPADERSRR